MAQQASEEDKNSFIKDDICHGELNQNIYIIYHMECFFQIDDASSDSGYSDPSPDGRDGKSPESLTDRKSPFSDRNTPDSDRKSPESDMIELGTYVVPNVIIQNNNLQTASTNSINNLHTASTNSINKAGAVKSFMKKAASKSSLHESLSSSVFPRSFSRYKQNIYKRSSVMQGKTNICPLFIIKI